jgi:Ser/Thr protein kinase RdoA (MazF antagonist)
MVTDGASGKRGELAHLRRLGRIALAQFGLDPSRLRLLRHEHNTTFRVDSNDSTFVLRINRSGVHGPHTIGSEAAWLRALVRDTDSGVPEPVVALDGSLVVLVPPVEGTEPHPAVLFRWQDGSFVDKRITPRHIRQVGILQAGLQRHAAQWARPEEFVRPRVDALTTAAKKHSIAHNDAASGPQPTLADAEATIALVDKLRSASDGAVVDRALQIVWATTSELARQPGAAGLIHADLHLENVLPAVQAKHPLGDRRCSLANGYLTCTLVADEPVTRPVSPALERIDVAQVGVGDLHDRPRRGAGAGTRTSTRARSNQ